MSFLKVSKRTEDVLLRASDVASRLNISRSLAYKLMQSGKIQTVKINRLIRVRPSDLEEFIQSRISPNEAALYHNNQNVNLKKEV